MSTYATVTASREVKVKRWELNSNFKNPCKVLTFSYPFPEDFEIGTQVVGKIVQSGVETKMFTGTVKSYAYRRPENAYEFNCQDVLARAVEYWFAPPTSDGAWERRNITHLQLIKDILNEATITNAMVSNDWPANNKYTGEAAYTFTFAVGEEPVKVKISSAWDIISWICTITGAHVYADADNLVHIGLIWDEVAGSDTPGKAFTVGNTGTTKAIEYIRSDENLRNKVVVFGGDGVRSEASAASPYLPANFYKTVVISHEMIEGQANADVTANINLQRLNKLTESAVLTALGQTNLNVRDIVSIVDAKTGISGNWFVMQCKHSVTTDGGYVVRFTGTR